MLPEGVQAAITALGTQSLLFPTSTGLSSIGPIPTVVPEKPHFQHVTKTGGRTLWVVFIVMLISSAVFTFLSWSVPVSKRVFHILTTVITIFASISYFAMATGHGVSFKHIRTHDRHNTVPDIHHDIYRQVFWARYVDWALTTPLIIIDLGFLAGISGAHILLAVIADVIMILTGLFAAFGNQGTGQKWGWYAIACVAYLVVIWHLVVNGRLVAQARSNKVGVFFTSITAFTLVIWTVYPIVWGLADGSRRLSVDAEVIAYAVLDILAKPVFGTWLLATHAKLPELDVDIGGFWAHGVEDEGALRLRDDGA